MANTKQTSKSVASKASKILRSGNYSKTSKSVAGSALSQTKTTGKHKESFARGCRITSVHTTTTKPKFQ